MSDKKIDGRQSVAARGLLGWSRADLAERSKVSMATLADFEAGKRTPYARTLDDIIGAFEAAGVVFIPENGGGAGVRLAKGTGGDR
jgi:transcriptional regulator with XRE-family HTH domain